MKMLKQDGALYMMEYVILFSAIIAATVVVAGAFEAELEGALGSNGIAGKVETEIETHTSDNSLDQDSDPSSSSGSQ